MVRSRVVSIGLLLGVAGASACTTVRSVPPAQYLAENTPEMVWVTYTDNTVVSVAEPEIRRDTLRGKLQGERIKIPIGEVRSVQAKVPDHAKTAILLTSLGVATVTSVYFILAGQSTGTGGGEGVYCPNDVRGRPLQTC